MAYQALPSPVRAVCHPLLVSVLLHGLLLTAPWLRPVPQVEATSAATPKQGEAIATVRLEDLLVPAADSPSVPSSLT
ncbi:hypothetical protein, partial [Nodosilinea sp. LEGE 07298]|uniref:hypothetical protein n=1 Tax=Nodosilinea sp. LEGE 07298 TaxID=2777970 RepID=UPI0018808DE8